MSGNKAIFDTNVIIFASKGLIDIEKLLDRYDRFYISIISYMEIYGYVFQDENERRKIDNIIDNFEIIEVDFSIAQQVIQYKQTVKKKIKLPDAIILATANYLQAELITDDWDDFINIDANVKIITLEEFKYN